MSTPSGPESTQLLDGVRADSRAAILVELRRLHKVLEWCVLHETDEEAVASFGDHGIPLAGDADDVGRCDNTRSPLLAETIRAWCANPDATIIVKPVIDLADHIHVNAYEIPGRLGAQDVLVDHHCVFPWCTRPARSCDIDHAQPYAEGGATCSCNTAPLCRGHHRLKTHGGWSYDVLDRGTYLWHSPHGHLFRRDHTGTEPLDPQQRRRP